MHQQAIVVSFLFLVGITASCQKYPSIDTHDYLIFGEFRWGCSEDCVHFYRLDEISLFSDAEHHFDHDQDIVFQDIGLDPNLRMGLMHLLQVPPMLLASACDEFGEINSWKQSTILIEVRRSGVRNRWLVGIDLDRLPLFLQSYVASIVAAVQALPK